MAVLGLGPQPWVEEDVSRNWGEMDWKGQLVETTELFRIATFSNIKKDPPALFMQPENFFVGCCSGKVGRNLTKECGKTPPPDLLHYSYLVELHGLITGFRSMVDKFEYWH